MLVLANDPLQTLTRHWVSVAFAVLKLNAPNQETVHRGFDETIPMIEGSYSDGGLSLG